MRAYKQAGYDTLFTRSAPFFTVYPSMIGAAGFERHVQEGYDWKKGDKPVALLDSPTNPQGHILGPHRMWMHPIIWDAVYHNNVYGLGLDNTSAIGHDVVCGSYSKLLGLNGIRVGWLATNDSLLFERMKDLVTAEYCGLSTASTMILLQYLGDPCFPFYWYSFEQNARYKLDFNRGEWSKLEKYFDGHPVSKVGMFYYAHADSSCKRLLDKAGVLYMLGSKLGHSDDFIRINLGQDNKLIKKAVAAVLKSAKAAPN
jgi:aspartate/methionine/tyrosine aminotransferase